MNTVLPKEDSEVLAMALIYRHSFYPTGLGSQPPMSEAVHARTKTVHGLLAEATSPATRIGVDVNVPFCGYEEAVDVDRQRPLWRCTCHQRGDVWL